MKTKYYKKWPDKHDERLTEVHRRIWDLKALITDVFYKYGWSSHEWSDLKSDLQKISDLLRETEISIRDVENDKPEIVWID